MTTELVRYDHATKTDSIRWAIETHIAKSTGLAGAADVPSADTIRYGLLTGTMDAPSKIELWCCDDPMASQPADFVWTPQDGLRWLDRILNAKRASTPPRGSRGKASTR